MARILIATTAPMTRMAMSTRWNDAVIEVSYIAGSAADLWFSTVIYLSWRGFDVPYDTNRRRGFPCRPSPRPATPRQHVCGDRNHRHRSHPERQRECQWHQLRGVVRIWPDHRLRHHVSPPVPATTVRISGYRGEQSHQRPDARHHSIITGWSPPARAARRQRRRHDLHHAQRQREAGGARSECRDLGAGV